MTSPHIIISGDFLRPGQDGNIVFLFAALRDRVTAVFGTVPEIFRAPPLPWAAWRYARTEAPDLYKAAWGAADLVIGFELPPAARAVAWIDVRRHPLRFDAKQAPWSIQASFALELAAPPLTLVVPRVRAKPGCYCDIAIMLQMESDAALLDGTALLRADDLAPEFARLAGAEARVWLVPHPNEPRNTWLDALQLAIPRAQVWPGTAYEAMASVRRMFTVSSSTGFEAPHFGCSPTFLRKPEEPSLPYDLGNVDLWHELAGIFQLSRPVACAT